MTVSPELALARALLAGGALPPQLRALAERHAQGVAAARAMLSRIDHAAPASVGRIAAMFDAAVAQAPEASVALYSLNDPAILARATDELVAWLQAEGLTGRDKGALDLGCGTGRVAAAVAPLCRQVLGADVSPGMIAAAQARHRAPNLRFAVSDGRTLPDGRFDLVLAADAMPYMVQAGVAERVVAQAAQALTRGGALAVLNLSYRGIEADRATARGWAQGYGLALVCEGATPFALWDGAAFVFRRVT